MFLDYATATFFQIIQPFDAITKQNKLLGV
jgi:hypothetical protein